MISKGDFQRFLSEFSLDPDRFSLNIFGSPAHGGPGTFYRIKKSETVAEIWSAKVGSYAGIFVKLYREIQILSDQK